MFLKARQKNNQCIQLDITGYCFDEQGGVCTPQTETGLAYLFYPGCE